MLPKGLLQQLQQENEVLLIPAGQVILDFHKYIRSIPIIISGSVKVQGEDDEGNEIMLYHIRPGESCIMSILGALNNSESKVKAITLEPTKIVTIKPEKVHSLINANPEWFDFIMSLYQTRFEELLQTVTRISFKSIEQRVMDMLQKRALLMHTKVVEITHQQIANELGTAREVVSRSMKVLAEKKQIKIFRGKVQVM